MSHDVASSIEEQVAQLQQRVQQLEDREQIHALFMEYRRVLDEKDFQAYANLFTEDGLFTTTDPAWQARGRDGIHAMVTGMVGSMLTVRGGDDFHIVGNVQIVLDGDRARARSTWTYVLRGETDEPVLAKIGHYEDELVREDDGQWRFAHRHAPTDVPAV